MPRVGSRPTWPHAKVSGGVSTSRSAFVATTRFARLCIQRFCITRLLAGMDMGIVNAGQLEIYEEIEPELKVLVEDVLLNRVQMRQSAWWILARG